MAKNKIFLEYFLFKIYCRIFREKYKMNNSLKARWIKTVKGMKESGYSKEYIRKQIGISKTSIYCYSSSFETSPKYPQYVTKSNVSKIEAFLKHRGN